MDLGGVREENAIIISATRMRQIASCVLLPSFKIDFLAPSIARRQMLPGLIKAFSEHSFTNEVY